MAGQKVFYPLPPKGGIIILLESKVPPSPARSRYGRARLGDLGVIKREGAMNYEKNNLN
jgi:hypothetical protein